MRTVVVHVLRGGPSLPSQTPLETASSTCLWVCLLGDFNSNQVDND